MSGTVTTTENITTVAPVETVYTVNTTEQNATVTATDTNVSVTIAETPVTVQTTVNAIGVTVAETPVSVITGSNVFDVLVHPGAANRVFQSTLAGYEWSTGSLVFGGSSSTLTLPNVALTFSATATRTITFAATGSVAYRNVANTFTLTNTFSGDVYLQGFTYVETGATLDVTGSVIFRASVTIGDDARITGSPTPSGNGVYDFGTSTLNWRKAYLQTIRLSALPTSASGLSSGDVWNDGGTLKIV